MSGARRGWTAVFVAPLLPFPARTGGQKRTLRLLEAAARVGIVPHLVTADESASEGAADALRERGWTVDVVPEPRAAIAGRLAQHARRHPSPYLHGVARRVAEVAAGAAFVQLEHTLSATLRLPSGPPVLLSLQNHDSAIAEQAVAATRRGTVAWARERNRLSALRAVERRAVPAADVVIVVSESDARAVVALGGTPLLAANGVDDAFFDVAPQAATASRALFFGDFGYAPNADGLLRFAREGWPRVRSAVPAATLGVAGPGMPTALRTALTAIDGVEVVGLVDDLTRSLAAASVTVVPIWQGGGTRLKVLEAMAAARPVVGTTLGVEGVGFATGRHGLVTDAPAALGDATALLLADPARAAALGAAAREHAEQYRWVRTTAALGERYASYR